MRIDLRCALDVPDSPDGQPPSCFGEFGWSLYENAEPDEFNRVMSVMAEGTKHPHWNQQLLFNNPPELLDLSGFFWLHFRDKNQMEPF